MNKVVHFEIPYAIQERAKRFYQGVFGWDLQDFPGMEYTVARTVAVDKNQMPLESGAINGGMMKREATAESPILVIDVPSIDDHVQKIEKAGGKLVKAKASIGDMGFYARVADTEGNTIGLWETLPRT